MAFTSETNKVPAAIGDIEVQLTNTSQVRFSVQVLQADGSIFSVVTGNLAPHLTAGQISGLQSFMADMRTKAVAELLP